MYDKSKVIENVKLLTEEDNTALISLLVDKAEATIRAYCDVAEINEDMSDIVEDMACLKYNLRGTEGITSQSLGKTSTSFTAGIPQDILTRLNKFRSLRMW